MVILSVPWMVVLGCSCLFIQDIGPGLSLYTVGAQGKIGPHIYIYIYINCLLIDYESKKQIEINIYNNKCKNRISHAKTTFPKGPIPSPK